MGIKGGRDSPSTILSRGLGEERCIIELGGVGNMSDAQIFNDTELYECLQEGSIGVPPPCPMTNDNQDMPYVWYDSASRPTKLC